MTQSLPPTNAVAWFAAALERPQLARMLRALGAPPERTRGRAEALRRALVDAFALDLAGFLNLAGRAELDGIAAATGGPGEGTIGELRAALWLRGAEREAGGRSLLGTPLQPAPIVLRGKLVHLARGRGLAPPAPGYPRPVPPRAPLPRPEAEPDTLEALLDNADALLGARLGRRGRDKGAYGARIARALGVGERGHSEPDWRGEVELKTVPVVRDRSGWWRVKEDPAVSMEGASPLAKLRRVLWIARVADDPASPVLSWYYQECDAALRRLLARDLHTRPKGPAGTAARGWYLHKRFFIDSGLLGSLNG